MDQYICVLVSFEAYRALTGSSPKQIRFSNVILNIVKETETSVYLSDSDTYDNLSSIRKTKRNLKFQVGIRLARDPSIINIPNEDWEPLKLNKCRNIKLVTYTQLHLPC